MIYPPPETIQPQITPVVSRDVDTGGFDILGSQSDMFNSWIYAGFTKDETRKAAFKKYEQWRKANLINKDESPG